MEMLTGAESARHCRKPEIVSEAAYAIFCRDAKSITGKFLIDEEVLKEEGFSQVQIDQYACDPCKRFRNNMIFLFMFTYWIKILLDHKCFLSNISIHQSSPLPNYNLLICNNYVCTILFIVTVIYKTNHFLLFIIPSDGI